MRRLPPWKRRLSLVLAFSLASTLSLAGCGSSGGGGGGGGSALADTTVLVYLIGANLESRHHYATLNLYEMMAVGSNATMNVVVQTGGARASGVPASNLGAMLPENVDWTRVQRYLVQRDSLEQLEDLGFDRKGSSLDMGSATALQEFLEWGVETYPARRYVVILWDHGGGVNSGVGPDELTDTTLPVAGISQALSRVRAGLDAPVTLVGFDACLMATAEVAGSLRGSAQVLVASQDLSPGEGWDYTALLGFIDRNPSSTGVEIGTTIADSFKRKHLETLERGPDHPLTLSVVDLTKVQALVDATNGFAEALMPYTQTRAGWMQIAKARTGALDWETSAIFGQTYDLVDLMHFAVRAAENVNENIESNPVLTDRAEQLASAVTDAVAYQITTGSDVMATGLTVYFPSLLWAYSDRDRKYADKTTSDGKPLFAVSYTDGTVGLVAAYHRYYLGHGNELEASVKAAATETRPLVAQVSNDFDFALASYWPTEPCKLFSGSGAGAPSFQRRCSPGMQVVTQRKALPDGKWELDVDRAGKWPHVWGFPVVLVPDQVDMNRASGFSTHMIPVFLYVDASAAWTGGYLMVGDKGPQKDDIGRYTVLGFQESAASSPSKSDPVRTGQVYALGAYYGGMFLRTDRTVMVENNALSIDEVPVDGGSLGYLVTDLTGLVATTEPVDLRPRIVEFKATPEKITAGESSILEWSVAGATSGSIDHGVGSLAGTSVYVKPEVTTTYTLTAVNGNAITTRQVTVTVTPAPVPTPAPAPEPPAP